MLPLLDETAVQRAIRTGACNIYHGCVHNMLYEKSADILKGLYKSASFVVQAIVFMQTGTYIKRQQDLLAVVSEDEQKIVSTALALKSGAAVDFNVMSEVLFRWASAWVEKM